LTAGCMSDQFLTDELARLMGWTPRRDRYVKPDRRWIPKWRFSPFTNVEDAFELLDKVADRFTLTGGSGASVTVEVRLGNSSGCASADSAPRAIATAVARALGLSKDRPE